MALRIVGGEWGGRIIKSPPGLQTRPTSDPHREALFNVLEHRFGECHGQVADFFAGSGALGFEALSRGAETCDFFESDTKALRTIEANAEILEINNRIRCHKVEKSFEWKRAIARATTPWSLIFSDPPYEIGLTDALLRFFSGPGANTLAPGAILILEMARKESPTIPPEFSLAHTWEHGATKIVFLKSPV